MNKILLKLSFFSLFLFGLYATSNAQFKSPVDQPWKSSQLIMPETLNNMISAGKKVKIYNIGVVQDIKGAVNFGAASSKENLENFKKAVKDLPKNEFIVFYCGCCPMDVCPNIRPAFKMLTEQQFTNIHLLNLPVNVKTDWVDKGYPLNEEAKN